MSEYRYTVFLRFLSSFFYSPVRNNIANDTMKKKNISQYKLIKEYHISNGQLDRLRKNADISTFTLNRLCEILDCRIEDIAQYRKE